MAKSDPKAAYQSVFDPNTSGSTIDISVVPLSALSDATTGAQSSPMTFAAAPKGGVAASITSNWSPPSPYYPYEHDAEFLTYYRGNDADGSHEGSFKVDVNFTTFGGSVKVNWIEIENHTGFPLTIDTFRWEAADGSPMYRGPGGVIAKGSSQVWVPNAAPIRYSEDPSVHVSAHFYDAPNEFGGDGIVKAAPI